ncbi:MAG: hypothetical protein IKN73_04450 [Alphaproteobacteria bacterium]|nr:hypothetical protein [Alphaproteobacteria bacterium]
MDTIQIVNILKNSGIQVCGSDGAYIYYQDPSCILPVFDKFVGYAWTIILVLTAFMLLGWAILYIRNGVRLDTVFKNAKSLLLMFATLAVVIPAINFIYGGTLFKKFSNSEYTTCENQYKFCKTQKVSINKINKLYEQRNAHLSRSDEYLLYEDFRVIVSEEYEDEQE